MSELYEKVETADGKTIFVPAQPPVEHVHIFTIPLEWEYKFDRRNRDDKVLLHFSANAATITKLGCECGEEKER